LLLKYSFPHEAGPPAEKEGVSWLTGVRRVGKTTLARSLPDTTYYDCELPRVRRLLEEDPEGFLEEQFPVVANALPRCPFARRFHRWSRAAL